MTPKNKNILLICSILLILILVYRGVLAKTINLRRQINLMQSEKAISDDIKKQKDVLILRERLIDSIFKANNIEGSSVQQNLLSFLQQELIDSETRIVQFDEPHGYIEDNLKSVSYAFKIQGSYRTIQEVLYRLEQEQAFGKLIHVSFEKKKEYRKNTNYLECMVIVNHLTTP